jgi:IS30 family transposase
LSLQVEHNKDKERDRIAWRRSKVQEFSSQGYSQRDIAQTLQVSSGTVNRDLSVLRQQAKYNIKRYIDERPPEEYEKCLVGLTAILREAWNTSQQAQDKREKIQALLLAKECYSMKLELLTNATVVDDAIRFVAAPEKSRDKYKNKDKDKYKDESSELAYNHDDDKDEQADDDDGGNEDDQLQLEGGEQKQEQGAAIAVADNSEIF